MTKKNPKYDVPSLKMGFKILEHLSHFPRGKMLTDIAEALGCPVSSAYRITMALEDMGLVVRDAESKQIRLTNKLLLTGQRAITETNLIESSLDIMREMRDRVVDTVLIGVRDGTEVVVLDQVTGARMFCFVAKLGYRIGVHCSAPGKAILAFLPDAERETVLSSIRFVRHNARTLTTRTALQRELDSVVSAGYAFDNSEQFEGVYCIGAPILDRVGYPVAALWVTGLMMDLDRDRVPQIGAHIRECAFQVSNRLGFVSADV
ncbi:MAG TPA: IclR family transcriptional regulator [Kiritimatiellia bacterium]|jgi:DNA-binding IclR family transcriptional regulator|nr:MAG: Transcriptional regulator KdgR [Verrucomicrobia bacterium ADurb.Bin070]HPB10555.1 IclR family transcriptional regulator [Kiritimatiellia bacterium]HPO36550.1 IclR family transcriptional regulator [Kiritimatiellia bacterium]HQA38239.1 IclR family transcriptional regulator [Kiritimatiellia bacterium]HQL50415.1 IclR family transcriptional regulator [Kiritimatiellia bacterium]